MNKKKLIVSALAMLALFGALGTMGVSHAAAPGFTPVAVTNAYWYSANSTELVSPGSNYTPLFVQFTVAGDFSYVNASVNLTYYANSPFSYSYINGPNTQQRSYYNITAPTPGQSVTIVQLVNVSSAAQQGIYEVALQVTTNATPTTVSNSTFQVAVLGTPDLTLVNYFTNPPIIYQDQKFITLTAVVSNTGAGPVKNTQFWVNSSAFTSMTGAYNVAYMPSGYIENFTFLLNAMNTTGQKAIYFHMGSQVISIPVYLHNYGTLGITSSIPALTPGAGSVMEQFNITNNGNHTMYGVNVHLLSPSVISIHVPSTNPLAALTADNFTIAQLNPGQSVVVTYLVDVSSSAALQTYQAQIVVGWNLNNTASQFHQTYNFNEKVTPTVIQQFTSNFTFTPLNIAVLLLVIVLIIALIAVSARSRGMRKKLKKAAEKQEKPASLIHRDIPGEKKEEQKD